MSAKVHLGKHATDLAYRLKNRRGYTYGNLHGCKGENGDIICKGCSPDMRIFWSSMLLMLLCHKMLESHLTVAPFLLLLMLHRAFPHVFITVVWICSGICSVGCLLTGLIDIVSVRRACVGHTGVEGV